jgi:sialate O-acetylesterase
MAMMRVQPKRQISIVPFVITAATMFSHLSAADVVTLAGDYQVIQRGADNTGACFAPLGGVDVPAGATIKYSVTLQERAVASGDKKIDAALTKEEAGAEITALKPGGPYRIEISAVGGDGNVLARAKYDNILVGDLWVVAGQSNAAGFAPVKERLARDPMANMFGMDGVWKPAIPPTHRTYESDARVIKDFLLSKCGFKSDEQIAEAGRKSQTGEHPVGGAGCDVFFASWLARESGIPQGLIPTAFAATSLDDWSPDLLSKEDASLYGSMIRRIARVGGKVRGMIWYQGEAEAANPDPNINSTYYERFKRFVESVRRDSKNPDMVFLTIQLGRVVMIPPEAEAGWAGVREQQRLLAADVRGVYVVPAADLELTDGIHIGWAGHKILGVRLARLALPQVTRQGDRRGIDLASVRFANDERTAIQVDFNNVAGKLRSDGLPRGFTLSLPGQPARDLFFDIGFDEKNPNRVVLYRGTKIDPAAKVSYAQGLNPVANLTDGEGMAPCSFGPVDIK